MQMIILPGMDVAENMAILMDVKELATKAIFFTVAKHRLKEQYHVSYDKTEEKPTIDSLQGRWVGYKFVI